MGMRQKMAIRATSVACILFSWTVVRAADPLSLPALRAAVVPGADFVISVDSAGWNKTAIQKELNAIKDELTGAGLNPDAMKFKARMDEALKALGIAEEDLVGLLVSAHIQGITEAEVKPNSPQQAFQQLGFVLSFSLAKPITTASIRSALNSAAADSGVEFMYEKGTYNGAETLSVVVPETPEGAPPRMEIPRDLLLALVDDGRAGYIGFEPQVKATVDRAVSGKTSELTEAMSKARKATMDGALSYVLFVPGESMRGMASARGAQMQQQNPMMAGAIQAFGGLQHLVLGATGSDTIDARISAQFDEPQQAGQIKSVVDVMLLGMAKMMVMQALGRPIALMDSLKSSQAEAAVAIDATVTVADVKALMELQSKGQRAQPPVVVPDAPAPE